MERNKNVGKALGGWGGRDRQGREWGGKGANMAKVGKEREGCSEWHHLKEELGKVEGEGGRTR